MLLQGFHHTLSKSSQTYLTYDEVIPCAFHRIFLSQLPVVMTFVRYDSWSPKQSRGRIFLYGCETTRTSPIESRTDRRNSSGRCRYPADVSDGACDFHGSSLCSCSSQPSSGFVIPRVLTFFSMLHRSTEKVHSLGTGILSKTFGKFLLSAPLLLRS